ncbi:MAG: hypothetical protein ABI579_05620, partial [Candidatus Sumerlaeota bacterium]
GWRAVIVMIAVLLWITYSIAFFLAAKISRSFWIALLIAVMGVAIGRRMFYPRPPVVSNLMMMAEIALLVAINERWVRRAWAFVLIPFIALWTNLHGGWMAGGLILGAWMVGEVVRRFSIQKKNHDTSPPHDFFPLTWMFVLGISCLLATFANPFGIELYKLPARVMSDPMLVAEIVELAPPNYFYVVDFALFALLIFIVGVGTIRRLKPPLWEILIWSFFLYQAVSHVRHLLLFSVAMVPLSTRIICALVELLADAVPIAQHRAAVIAQRLILAGVALYAAAWVVINPREGGQWLHPFTTRSYPGRNVQFADGDGYMHDAFPVLVCDFIGKADLKGDMFNENFYAGYLIWRLSPEKHRVFSDPRFDIFGSRFLLQEKIIAAGGAAKMDGKLVTWDALLDSYKIQWAITRTDTGLHDAFMASPDWVMAAMWLPELGGWEIWIRKTPGNQAMITRAKNAAPGSLAFAPK